MGRVRQHEVAATHGLASQVGCTGLKRGEGEHRLDRRTGWIRAANRSVKERLCGVVLQFGELRCRHAQREQIGVKRRCADKGEDLSGPRIKGDDGAAPPPRVPALQVIAGRGRGSGRHCGPGAGDSSVGNESAISRESVGICRPSAFDMTCCTPTSPCRSSSKLFSDAGLARNVRCRHNRNRRVDQGLSLTERQHSRRRGLRPRRAGSAGRDEVESRRPETAAFESQKFAICSSLRRKLSVTGLKRGPLSMSSL